MGNCIESISGNGGASTPVKRRPKSGRAGSAKGGKMVPAPKKEVQKIAGDGAYLCYDTGSEGVWVLHWSHEPVEGALAYFKPNKKVQPFKYNQNGGKSVLMNVRSNKKKYMEGIMQFVKLAVDFNGEVLMYDNDDAEIVYMNQDNKIVHIQHGEWFNAEDIRVLAVMPRYSQVFKGLKSTLKEAFLDTASANRGVTWSPRPKTIKIQGGLN